MTSAASDMFVFGGGGDAPASTPRRGTQTRTPLNQARIPLMDLSNTTRSRSTQTMSTSSSTPCAGLTTFLPEIHSTPPMPTFQKPDMSHPMPLSQHPYHEDADVTPSRPRASKRSTTSEGESNAEATFMRPVPKANVPYSTVQPIDRLPEMPPLPRGWRAQHDRAICVLDASDYSLSAIVSKIRRVFPDLDGALTIPMIDKRLRQLDQNIYIDYWAVGLAKNDRQQRREQAKLEGANKARGVRSPGAMLSDGDSRAVPAKNQKQNAGSRQKKSASNERVDQADETLPKSNRGMLTPHAY